ncbi:hypothetical protein M406DRAFT_19796, partial [Cryphonectria parasitica EP155]
GVTMASPQQNETGLVQILHYLKRNPKLTRKEFWEYWQGTHGPKLVPLVEFHGCHRYQQLHTFGTVIPNSSADSAPNAVRNSPSASPSAAAVEFDGIAMFLVPSLDAFRCMVEDPYYVNVVEPDEHNLLDKAGPGGGVVASVQGTVASVVQGGRTV